jgi:hypothetical protein
VPRIQWTNLPPALRDHLFDRLRDRKITVEDLYQLKLWRESEPEAPEGPWFKDFGSFKVCLSTVLPPGIQLRYAGRPASASPATGNATVHKAELAALLVAAFGGPPSPSPGGRGQG